MPTFRTSSATKIQQVSRSTSHHDMEEFGGNKNSTKTEGFGTIFHFFHDSMPRHLSFAVVG